MLRDCEVRQAARGDQWWWCVGSSSGQWQWLAVGSSQQGVPGSNPPGRKGVVGGVSPAVVPLVARGRSVAADSRYSMVVAYLVIRRRYGRGALEPSGRAGSASILRK